MKKIIILAFLFLLLTGCTGNDNNTETEINESSTDLTGCTGVDTVTEPEAEKLDLSLIENLPSMDGSTSAIPLEAGIKSELLGINHSEALELVNHTTTHEAFVKLINKEVDMIFSVPVSEEQKEKADEESFQTESVPVAMEGFVFAVNVENPVDTLSTEQLRKIYSGEITNWKDVGGLDEPIIAYQRNQDSGSQNYMTEFMNGIPLMEVPTELIPGFMGGLMDAVSIYDNSRQAIGYSVYSYAAQMYANANQVKFIKVDGIEPSKTTFSDKTYPLLSCTYIYFDKTLPSDSSVRLFADWVASSEGQLCVLKNGYVPVMDIEIPPEYLLYKESGTGRDKANDYAPSKRQSMGSVYPLIETSEKMKIGEHDEKIYHAESIKIDSLVDKEIEAKINSWLAQALEEIKPYSPILVDNGSDKTNEWRTGHGFTNSSDEYVWTDLYYEFRLINGYLSLLMGYVENCPYYDENSLIYYNNHYTVCRTAVFDLFTGEKIENFSDLFYKDVNFLPFINNNITKYISNRIEPAFKDMVKINFSGLLGEIKNFTFDKIILGQGNPYFYCGTELMYGEEWTIEAEKFKDDFIIWEYRNQDDLFIKEENEYGDIQYLNAYIYDFKASEYITEDYVGENGTTYTKIVFSRFYNEDEINEINNIYVKVKNLAMDNDGYQYGRISIKENMYVVDKEQQVFEGRLYFDKETFKLLTEDDLFKAGWKETAIYQDNKIPDDGDEFIGFLIYEGDCNIYYKHYLDENSYTQYCLTIPTDYVVEKYRN